MDQNEYTLTDLNISTTYCVTLYSVLNTPNEDFESERMNITFTTSAPNHPAEGEAEGAGSDKQKKKKHVQVLPYYLGIFCTQPHQKYSYGKTLTDLRKMVAILGPK